MRLLDEAAASSGAVRDGSGLSAASSSASSNPKSGGLAPFTAAPVPSGDGDALDSSGGELMLPGDHRDGFAGSAGGLSPPENPVRIYCHGNLYRITDIENGWAVCPGCGKKLQVVW